MGLTTKDLVGTVKSRQKGLHGRRSREVCSEAEGRAEWRGQSWGHKDLSASGKKPREPFSTV